MLFVGGCGSLFVVRCLMCVPCSLEVSVCCLLLCVVRSVVLVVRCASVVSSVVVWCSLLFVGGVC